ncbi:Hypothetical predicted protein, partial [Olea europaea subsp. europaea]
PQTPQISPRPGAAAAAAAHAVRRCTRNLYFAKNKSNRPNHPSDPSFRIVRTPSTAQ